MVVGGLIVCVRVLRSVHLVKTAVSGVIDVGKFEFGLMEELFPQLNIPEAWVFPWGPQIVLGILQRIIGHQMMLDIVDHHRHRLFQQSVLLELVRVDQRTQQPSIRIFIETLLRLQPRCRRRYGRESIVFITGASFGRTRGGIWISGLGRPLPSLCRPFLLPRGKWVVQLPVDEKIGQDPTGTPRDPVRPSFDARRGLFVHKHVAADDELVPLAVVRPAKNVRESAGETGFEYDQGIFGRFDMPAPCWDTRRGLAGVHGDHWQPFDGREINLLWLREEERRGKRLLVHFKV